MDNEMINWLEGYFDGLAAHGYPELPQVLKPIKAKLDELKPQPLTGGFIHNLPTPRCVASDAV